MWYEKGGRREGRWEKGSPHGENTQESGRDWQAWQPYEHKLMGKTADVI